MEQLTFPSCETPSVDVDGGPKHVGQGGIGTTKGPDGESFQLGTHRRSVAAVHDVRVPARRAYVAEH